MTGALVLAYRTSLDVSTAVSCFSFSLHAAWLGVHSLDELKRLRILPRVFVVQEVPGRNITHAFDFGSVEVLLNPGVHVVLSPGPIARQMRNKLASFTDDDFIVPIGDPAAIGMATAIAAQANNGRFKLLKWDREHERYYPVSIDINAR